MKKGTIISPYGKENVTTSFINIVFKNGYKRVMYVLSVIYHGKSNYDDGMAHFFFVGGGNSDVAVVVVVGF
jgi:hypothetical protein